MSSASLLARAHIQGYSSCPRPCQPTGHRLRLHAHQMSTFITHPNLPPPKHCLFPLWTSVTHLPHTSIPTTKTPLPLSTPTQNHNAPLPLPPRCPDGPRGRPGHRHGSLHIDRDDHRDGVCPALLDRVGRHVHDDDRDAVGDAGCFAYVEYVPIFCPPAALLACVARVLLAGDGCG